MFGQQVATEEQHLWAANICNEFVQNNYKNWVEFFKQLANDSDSEILRFFFLQALTDIVKSDFESRLDRAERIAFLEASITFLKAVPVVVLSKNHFRAKYSQLVALLYFE